MKQIFLVLITFTFFSYGAYSKRTEKKERTQSLYLRKKHSHELKYILYPKGVECKLCAQSMVDLLEKIDGVGQVAFTMVGLDYTNSYLEFVWSKKNENIPLLTIKSSIEKEGFELASIEGQFLGSFECSSSNDIRLLLEPNMSLSVENPPLKLVENKSLMLKGKILYDDEKKEFKYNVL